VREIDGMPTEWIRGFSRRRSQVEATYDELVRDYVRHYGHVPPRTVQLELADQAALTTRPPKERLRTLAEQIADWTRHALALLPGVSIPQVIAGSLHRHDPSPTGVDAAAIAGQVVARVSQDRATWTVFHVRAEAHRQLRGVDFPDLEERLQAVETVTQRAR
jgi:hypothetical protein